MDKDFLDEQLRWAFRELREAEATLRDMQAAERKLSGNSGVAGPILENLGGAFYHLNLIDASLQRERNST